MTKFFSLVLVLAIFALSAVAQTNNGSISGTVVDENQAVVSGATRAVTCRGGVPGERCMTISVSRI